MTTAKESGGEKQTFAGRGREGIEIGRGNKRGAKEGRERKERERKGMVKKVEAAPVTDQRQVILELEAEWAGGEIESFNGAQQA